MKSPRSRKPKLDEDKLLRSLQAEERDASLYYDSELAKEQSNAMDRYNAKPYGDGSEVPNRSQVVTHDIEDAINWVLPHMMRHFTQSEDLIACDDDGLEESDPALADAANLLRHVFFKDNDGETVLHDFLFDGLLQKIGVMRTYWEQPDPEPPEVLEGLTQEQVMKYAEDRRYTILEGSIDGTIDAEASDAPQQQLPPPPQEPPQPQLGMMGTPTAPPPGMMGGGDPQSPTPLVPSEEPTFSIKVQKSPMGKGRFETIPPEEFRISRRAKSLDAASYHGWQFEEYLADLLGDHPDKAYELNPDGAREGLDELDIAGDERMQARFPSEPYTASGDQFKDDERRKVAVHIEYIRGDFDRDNFAELRRIKRCGQVILENDVVTESEFSDWSPIRVSHRAIGRSVADTLIDFQKIKTVLTRKALDSLSQSLAPRTLFDQQNADPGLIDRLLDHEVGDVIPVTGDPTKKIMPLVTPDVSASAYVMIEYMERKSEEASGINRHAMGINQNAVTDTKGGIENLQAAANSRIEQYARWAAKGLQDAMQKMLRILVKHQDQERVVKINGRRMKIDPSRWSSDMTVSVHVGMAAETRERKLGFLGAIAARQEQILLRAGPNNPLVSLKNYEHTLSQMTQAMGYRSSRPFFNEVPADWAPPEPGPDPKVLEVQQKGQLAATEMQQKGELQTVEFQQRSQLAREEAAAKAQLAREEAMIRVQREQESAASKAQQQAAENAMRAEQARLDAEAKSALAAAEFQRTTEIERYRADVDKERQTAELAHATQLAEVAARVQAEQAALKAESDRQLAILKAENEKQIALLKVEAETQIARERMDAEMEVARWNAGQQVKIARYKARSGASGKSNDNGPPAKGGDGNDSFDDSVRFGGQVG